MALRAAHSGEDASPARNPGRKGGAHVLHNRRAFNGAGLQACVLLTRDVRSRLPPSGGCGGGCR